MTSESIEQPSSPTTTEVAACDVPLDRDAFTRVLVGELAATLQDVVGVDEMSGFVSIVGQRMGRQIDAAYRRALDAPRLDRDQLAAVLVDLKRRIRGDFYVIEQREDRIVLGNRACPFADQVHGRPSLCMMTSNVFGSIAADNIGYAKVTIDEAIARGDDGCHVTVWLRRSAETAAADGREYFSDPLEEGLGGATAPGRR